MCVRVRACRYRCGRDCVWACSAAGREADSPLEQARPLRAGGQSGGCPGLRVLDAGRGRPGRSFGQSRHAAFLQDWRSGSWAEAAGALGGQTGPTQAAGLAGRRTWSLWPPRICATSFRPFPGPEGGLHLASLAGGEAYTRWFRQVPADEDPEGSARGSTWRRIFQGVHCPHTPAPAGPPGRPLLSGGLGEVPVCLNQSREASEGEAG